MNHMPLSIIRENNVQARKYQKAMKIEQFDGTISEVNHFVDLPVKIQGWQGTIRFELVQGLSEDMVLGNLWMAQHQVEFDWNKKTINIPPRGDLSVRLISAKKFRRILRTEGTGNMGVLTREPVDPQRPRDSYVLKAFKARSPRNPNVVDSRGLSTTHNKDAQHIPREFHEFLEVFDEEAANRLPERRPFDHQIPLYEGEMPPFGTIYGLSKLELDALKENIDENLAKGFIRPSQSPAAAPILFVKKKDGSLRLCVDYRGLNKVTIKNRNPLPLILEMLDRLSTAKYYTTIDLRNAYYQVRIAEGDEWKTAFRTKYGLFEYLVMPFGLTNAPSTFQHLINHVFHDMLDKFVIAYLDDILIFSDTKEEHEKHVKQVLARLKENKLYAKAEKCDFYAEEIEFLGYLVSNKGIRMDPAKVKSVIEWPRPRNIKEIRGFLGFANFYRHFIKNYSKLVGPLTDLTKTTRKYEWSDRAEAAFIAIKDAFAKGDIIHHFDPRAPITIETDASDFAIGAILSQLFDGKLKPIAFFSRKLNPAEMNYEIHDKELLAIVSALKAWRRYVEGTEEPVRIITDHQPLTYFQTKRMLSRRQARWNEILSEVNYKIEYRSGKKSTKPDALSRRPDYEPTEEDKQHNFRRVLAARTRSHRTEPSQQSATVTDSRRQEAPTPRRREISMRGISCETFENQLRQAQNLDPEIASLMVIGPMTRQDTQSGYGRDENGILYVDDRVYLPKGDIRLSVIEQYHDQPLAGHLGQARTLELVKRHFRGNDLGKFVRQYVASCDKCNRNKPRRHAPYGMMKPLPIPEKPWESISVDFINQLPVSDGYDAIMVVIDRRTKLAHFEPVTTKITTEELAKLFTKVVFSKHGVPKTIISDRGNKFVASLWKEFLGGVGAKRALSTTAHPQTDGQTERVNQWLDEYLRMYVNYQQDDWVNMLPVAEFAYNNAQHTTTTVSPFYATYGYHPRFSVLSNEPGKAEDYLDELHRVSERIGKFISEGQERQARYYNAKRKRPPTFAKDQLVWLSTKNFRIKDRTKKLTAKWVGPYRISEVISEHAYRLDLPTHMRINNSFHVSLLEPYAANPFEGRMPDPPPPVEVEGEDEFEVKEILDCRRNRGRLEYLVRWLGYLPDEDSWQPASNLANAKDLVDQFHKKYPNKPRPVRK